MVRFRLTHLFHVFLGEDHYVGSDKHDLASNLTLLATKCNIELHVEAIACVTVSGASDRLASLAGLPAFREYEKCATCLVDLLKGLPAEVATYFSPRPDDPESGLVVDPGQIIRLIEVARLELLNVKIGA